MPTKRSTGATTNPDAAIFEMGDRLLELDRQVLEFDAASVRLRRLGRLSESNEAGSRQHEAGEAYSDLEFELVYTPATTPEGHLEKIRIIERGGFSFDPDVLAEIMWMLAHEAGRLGLSDAISKRCKKYFARAAAKAA
jgi:hypothetical protein